MTTYERRPAGPMDGPDDYTVQSGRSPIRRLFPADGLVDDNGNPISSRSLGVLWRVPALARAETAAKLLVGAPVYSLALDPEFTTPGTVIGAHFGDAGHAFYFRPGDVLEIPGGVSDIWVWNALGWLRSTIWAPGATSRPLGTFAFLAGVERGVRPTFRADIGARGEVAMVVDTAVGNDPATGQASESTSATTFVSSGLRGMRCSFYAYLSASPVPGGVNPSDMSATARMWVLSPTTLGAAANAGADRVTAERPNAVLAWVRNAENDMVIDADHRSFDRDVPAGALAVALATDGVTGTGVDTLWSTVEVY